jgi:putative NADH-flavin reductase
MKIAVFGASGGTGKQIVQQALERGHSVTAHVRTPASLGITHEQLRVVQGDVLDPVSVNAAVEGQGAVICALGQRDRKPSTMQETGTGHIADAMRNNGVRRLILISALGVGDSYSQSGGFVFDRLIKPIFFGWWLKDVYASKERQEVRVKATGLEWTILRPTGLANGPKTGKVRVVPLDQPSGMRIPRADVASFALDEVENPRHLRQTITISS